MDSETLIRAVVEYADGRKSDVSRGAETAALASLMVEKFGYGVMKAAGLCGLADSTGITDVIDRLVREIDPQHDKHRQFRWQSRPAGLAVSVGDGSTVQVV